MRKIVLLLFAGLLSSTIYAQDAEFKVKVSIKNYPTDLLNIVFSKGESFERISINLKEGKGEATIKAPMYKSISLISTDPNHNIKLDKGIIPGPSIAFYVDGKDLTLDIDNSLWPSAKINGGNINSDLNRLIAKTALLKNKEHNLLRQACELEEKDGRESEGVLKLREERGKLSKEIRSIEEQFVLDNPKSYVSLNLLAGQRNSFSIADYEQRFNLLSPDLKNAPIGKEITAYITAAKKTAIGQSAPSFKKKDMNGKMVQLSDYKGKYLLIDFWGTWCGPCRSSHPHLVSLYEKYNKLGLEFLNIAQESNEASRPLWIAAIQEDRLTWTQILNNEGIKECDVVKEFGVTAFPTKILIDREGKILGRFVGDSEELDTLLKKLFNQ